ncbi:HPr-rel-A system PqqD family peptide chaperone [Methylocaldum sp. MU1018]
MRLIRVSKQGLRFSPAWPGESVVFDTATGDTHVLSGFGRAILVAAAEFPAGIRLTDFAQRFADDEARSTDESFLKAVEQAALEFQRLGLMTIEPA